MAFFTGRIGGGGYTSKEELKSMGMIQLERYVKRTGVGSMALGELKAEQKVRMASARRGASEAQARAAGSRAIAAASAAASRARAANEARQRRIEAGYREMMTSVGPGGAFEKAGLAEIETAKVGGVGRQMQQQIGAGMYGTTTTGGIERGWEAAVGQPARLKLEDVMLQRKLGIQQQRLGFMERVQEPYPEYGSLMQMLSR